MSEKLQKVLARTGQGSRREIESFIKQGRVSVNGELSSLGSRVEVTHTTKIRVDGHIITIKPIQNESCRMLLYYKREGELCSYRDPKRRPTVFEGLPNLNNSRWVAVGRLDINTSGLLLFTTDGELANRLMHPSFAIQREYAVRIFGVVNENKQRQLTFGMKLTDRLAAFQDFKFQGGEGLNQWYTVTLKEGRNRQVRRLCEAVGVQVSRLIRVRYGGVSLPKGLPRGAWIELSPEQINNLREKVHLPLQSVTRVLRKRHRLKTTKIRRAIKRIHQKS
ncbi:23S rRNA pseudouridine(2605) synthase RluB [Candidatus Steffania adelgidicola]|uniref:23S rRNA pseudouridine(2605) synthase RluB n=1 Tax=Candidatus Steffania adelgidicola TaxID=1076626 RepID=UPI001D01583C|nr:23S rRNA pseudouridine(2605) synthase RluB [Candidatus Steffania adelgidicola]UDG79908.1 Ribosomal large subunit pseudouridine synthase B [Candidatus Steffania adelgidicola]